MSLMSDIMKKGIATRIEQMTNESILKKPFNSPPPNEVPSKMLFLQIFPIPNIASPANPNVSTPIKAALRFCLYITRVRPFMWFDY